MITLRPGSHVWRLLLLLAICGEYPYRSLHLLGSVRTLEELVRRLEVVQHFRTPTGADLGTCKMLTTSGRGNRRTIRLYKSALSLLQALHPAALSWYLAATGGHRFSGSVSHVERNHRVAESVAICMGAGVETRPFLLPPLQKQAIRQAFIELLNERPLDKISVKDIAERSTVNRNTFYYYYADIYALVEEIFQTETQLFMEKLHSYASWEEAFREATAFVSENKRAVHHLFNSGNRNILEHYYHKVTYAAMLSYVRGQAEDLSAAEEDIQALAQFYAAALSGMTADWLRGGMKSNVNDHIDRLGRLLEGNIRQALERSCR